MNSYLKSFLIALLAISCLFIFGGCEKSEGEGGNASITGRIIEQRVIPLNDEVQHEYYAKDVRVYIIYGPEDRVYDDDMRTDFEGRFRFRWLRPGTYTIFVYSECNPNPNIEPDCASIGGEFAEIRSVQLEKNQDFVLDDIVIKNY